MRMLLVSLTLVALVLAAGGCDKPEPDPELAAFEISVDGGATAPTVSVDLSILEPRPKREEPPEITPLVTSLGSPAAPEPVTEVDAATQAVEQVGDAVETAVGEAMSQVGGERQAAGAAEVPAPEDAAADQTPDTADDYGAESAYGGDDTYTSDPW
ncbi:MAG: hypothetical protein ACOC7R_03350 [Planctomycetota bacterium]